MSDGLGMDRRSFGRRAAPHSIGPRVAPAEASVQEWVAPAATALPEPLATLSVDDELHAWKQQRGLRVPWKQLCLMASICFGVASLVLPDDVNKAVNWLLYGLTAMSLYAWYTGRRARAKG
jgi:hypothetical protein